ncbi:hypothetical protein LINGRAHAP2_LOCUS2209 [Linum grandiflorum]
MIGTLPIRTLKMFPMLCGRRMICWMRRTMTPSAHRSYSQQLRKQVFDEFGTRRWLLKVSEDLIYSFSETFKLFVDKEWTASDL